MKKIGRPKKYINPQDRKKLIMLTEKASILFKNVQRVRPNFNFSRYVSEHIINDFGSLDGMIKVLKREIGKNNKEIDAMQEENKKLVFKIKELQEEEMVREIL